MKPATILTLLLSAAIPLNVLVQTGSTAQSTAGGQSGSSGQSNAQNRPFPTNNYYRSPYARPPGYRPGEYAQRAYARQQQQEEEQKHPQSQQQQQSQTSKSSSQYMGAGAASDKAKGYTYKDTVNIDGINRTFQVHLPAGYRSMKNMPLVLAFHGLHLNGTLMMFLSGFNSVSDKNGFVVVYGDGIGEQWDDGRGAHGYDDVGYVCKVIEKVSTTVSIDKRHVYACGISNGGYFSQLLACAIPDRLAAIGVVGATLVQGAANHCHSSRPMPIMFFLGTGDPLVAWGSAGNGSNVGELGDLAELVGVSKIGGVDSVLARYGGIMPVPEVIDFWTAHNRCPSGNPYTSMEPDRDPKDGTRVKKEAWGSTGNEVVLYRIEGGGHTWPGGMPYASQNFAGRISRDIDASETLWQFFKTHSR